MRVAVLSESPADEAAIRILIESVLGRPTQSVEPPPQRLRTRGWPSVLLIIPKVLQHLHYHTDAEACAIVVDTDASPVHQATHEQPGGAVSTCRLCQLRQVVTQTQTQLRSIPGRPPLQAAVGVAVPAIEAWYCCGRNPQVTEATWLRGLETRSCPYTRHSLKQDTYGTDRPSLELEMQRVIEAAQLLAQNLPLLERLFPYGFGSLAQAVRGWVLT